MLILKVISFFMLIGGYVLQQTQSHIRHSAELKLSNTTSTKVLIIGAGISGLEAARLLEQNGIETIVLEAQNRTGGRVYSRGSKHGFMLDMGARYIHGTRGSIPSGFLTNPLWDYTQEVNIPLCTTGDHDFLGLYPPSDKFTLANVQSWYDEYLTFVREETRFASLPNSSFAYYIDLFSQQKNFTSDQRDVLYDLTFFIIADREGAELEAIDAKSYLDITSINYGEEPVICDTGFMTITNHLAKGRKDIRLKQIVSKVNYTNTLIDVWTTDGQVYRADYVLITVSLGVLKSNTIEFYPSLPQWKLNAINRIGFGYYEKIYLLWEQPWWNFTNFYFFRPAPINSTGLRFWVSANKWNGVPSLMCTFSGKTISLLKWKENENMIVQEIQDSIQKMFPQIAIPTPTEIYMSNWNEDVYFRGSYSFISIDQKLDDPLRLSEPVENRLLFAGEATSSDNYGYSHGALLTARREVTRLLYVYNLLPKQNITTSESTKTTSTNTFLLVTFLSFQLLILELG
ncbi:unnamed protein product [Adineta ricciae]|uniref:Amine oxidase n=1 Tax=Adineta ricciae TaxID=249248 RepID=A0A815U0A2_ADIRI|nr:unnamed protein product [Adineta ricciae]CAF1513119.1 unnamed protein product [Adineta ricciae]